MFQVISGVPDLIFVGCSLVAFLVLLVRTRQSFSWNRQKEFSDQKVRYFRVSSLLIGLFLLLCILRYALRKWPDFSPVFPGSWFAVLLWISIDTRRFLKLLSWDLGPFSDREAVVYRVIFGGCALANLLAVIELSVM